MAEPTCETEDDKKGAYLCPDLWEMILQCMQELFLSHRASQDRTRLFLPSLLPSTKMNEYCLEEQAATGQQTAFKLVQHIQADIALVFQCSSPELSFYCIVLSRSSQ